MSTVSSDTIRDLRNAGSSPSRSGINVIREVRNGYPSHYNNIMEVDTSKYRSSSRSTVNPLREVNGDTSKVSGINAMEEVYGEINHIDMIYVDSPKREKHRRVFIPDNSSFCSLVTPTSELTPREVSFLMRRKNKVVTLQWQPFSGVIGHNGVTHLTVIQTIANLPPYKIIYPIYIEYKSEIRLTRIEIDPHAKSSNIKFYLNSDCSGKDINMGDVFFIPASSISWIVHDECH